jgi:hypothetical protein
MNKSGESSKMRKANSPIVNREKERKGEPDMNKMSDNDMQPFDEEVQSPNKLINQSQMSGQAFPPRSGIGSRKDSAASRDSYLSVTSKTGKPTEKPIRQPIFTTSKPDGAFRDEIVVELQTIDDQAFKGTITTKEARKKIFEDILGFKQEDLLGFYFAYSGCPIVTFKLAKQFNIDSLEQFQFFELERKFKVRNEERVSNLKCKIRGIRTKQGVDGDKYEDTGIRWVKIEGCEY